VRVQKYFSIWHKLFFGFLVEIKKIDNWTKEKKRNVRERKHRSLRNIKCTHKNVYKCCCSVTEQKKNKSINLKKIKIPLKGKNVNFFNEQKWK